MTLFNSLTNKLAIAGLALATVAGATSFTTDKAEAGWRARHAVIAAANRGGGARWGGGGYAPAYGYGRGGGWGNRGWRGPAVAAGVFGLAAGAIFAGAAQPAYAYPAQTYYPAQGYSQSYYNDEEYEQPQCYLSRRKVWIDDIRWTYRRVRVCR